MGAFALAGLWSLFFIPTITVDNQQAYLPDAKYAYLATGTAETAQAWQIPITGSAGASPVSAKQINTPLGSVWKLFVYSYLVSNQINSPDYQCTGRNREQEKYCCNKGERINREQALLQSCGLYFDPQRLNIKTSQWQSFWQKQNAPIWLTNMGNLHEKHTLPVSDLLLGLNAVPETAKDQASTTLLNLWLKEANQDSLAKLGTTIRAKTFTMPHPTTPKERVGGFAGWLADGQPVWFAARGNSMMALAQTGKLLPPYLPKQEITQAKNCVQVDYFAFSQNPITQITNTHKQPVYGGNLPKGQYTVYFQQGKPIAIESDDDLKVEQKSGQLRLTGTLGLNEYLARVIDREASTEYPEATKALVVAARSYLLQEASGSDNCLLMKDSTHMQRVAPRPATEKARLFALQTDQLILTGSKIHYQLEGSQKNQLIWQQAVKQDKNGLNFQQILTRAYPRATLVIAESKLSAICTEPKIAVDWLSRQSPKWQQQLRKEAGFKPLSQPPSLCALQRGIPYADVAANRIYIRQFKTQNDQIALAHEYLHLTFAEHPNGKNEQFIEQLAKRLVSGKTL